MALILFAVPFRQPPSPSSSSLDSAGSLSGPRRPSHGRPPAPVFVLGQSPRPIGASRVALLSNEANRQRPGLAACHPFRPAPYSGWQLAAPGRESNAHLTLARNRSRAACWRFAGEDGTDRAIPSEPQQLGKVIEHLNQST